MGATQRDRVAGPPVRYGCFRDRMLRVVEIRPAKGNDDDPVLVVEPIDERALRRSTAERKLEQHGFTQTAAAKGSYSR